MDMNVVKDILINVRVIGQTLNKGVEFEIKNKNGIKDLVTSMDEQTELSLRKMLKQYTPFCSFIGEEGDAQYSDHVWIIDPIDGTTNFINLQENYAISLGYYENEKPVLGIVYDVHEDVMYWAFQGKAYVNDQVVKNLPSIRSLNECVFDAGLYTLKKHPGLIELYQEARGHRCYGCASLSIIKVALGKLDFYCSEHAKCWDYAGGAVFLEACKGCCWTSKDFFTCEPCLVLVARDRNMLDLVKEAL